MSYHRTRSAPPKIGKTVANRFTKLCRYCGLEVPAGEGIAQFTSDGWVTQHRAAEWVGSPTSGRYAGGCPGEADKLNARFTA